MYSQKQLPENIRLIIAITTIIFLLLGLFLIFLLLYYRNSKNKHILERENLRISFQQTILQTQLEIQEQTLKNISQEIHDNIGQVLSLVKLNINTMNIQKPEDLQEKITDSKTLLVKAIQDLRDLSKSLDADQISTIGLLRAIETELNFLRKAGVQASLDIAGKPYRPDTQKELILFRIVQEVLNNIIKHANASHIEAGLHFEEHQLRLIVSDNGKGFDLASAHENENSTFGLGLRNMQNRARLIGADFSIISTPGNGTTIIIILPVATKPSTDAKS
jgi:signal transduction histidine kinase